MGFKRRYSLKKRKEFAAVHRRGVSKADRRLVVLYLRGGREVKVGLSVSKKLGGAVTRNHIKRLLRECVRPRIPLLKPGRYVIIARQGAVQAHLTQLSASFEGLTGKLGLLKANEAP